MGIRRTEIKAIIWKSIALNDNDDEVYKKYKSLLAQGYTIEEIKEMTDEVEEEFYKQKGVK